MEEKTAYVPSFGETLKVLRKKAGVTQKELAIALGETYVTISGLEGGELSPSRMLVEKARIYFSGFDEVAPLYRGGYLDQFDNPIPNKEYFRALMELVEAWGKDKGLTDWRNADKQFMKFIEEVFEFKAEMDPVLSMAHKFGDVAQASRQEMRLEFGDILVTLVILAKQLDIDPVDCLEMAYGKIKGRTGETINGVFVKSEDLEGGQ